MRRFKFRLKQIAGIGMLAACATVAGAAVGATSAAPGDENAGIVRQVHTELARSFVLPSELKLDPALRAAADKIAAAHLARMNEQLASWAQEERKLQGGTDAPASYSRVMFAVMARMLNELAYWQVEPGDAEYEKATLEVLRTAPPVCLSVGDPRTADFSSHILRIQAMAPAQQAAALATETRLLERWGKPHGTVLPWPETLPQDAAMEVLARLHSGGPRPAVALPPPVAWRVLSEGDRYDQLHAQIKCGLQRWWLEESLAQGRPAADVLNAFRYGTLVTATMRYGAAMEADGDGPLAAAPGRPAYPRLAQRFDVTGMTTITRRFDAAGKPEQARVIKRTITVSGIRGMRPIAFEDAFDALSVAHALKPDVAGTPGPMPAKVFQMVWSLDPRTPPGAKPDTSKGKQ